MVVLERIKASTLMETLVATVLIVIIFMISSMLLNNIFSNSIKGKDHHITERLQQLKYEYKNKKLKLPYYENVEEWEFSINAELKEGIDVVVFKAENSSADKSITKIVVDEK